METNKTIRLLISLIFGVAIVLAAVVTTRVEKMSKTIRRRLWIANLGLNSHRPK